MVVNECRQTPQTCHFNIVHRIIMDKNSFRLTAFTLCYGDRMFFQTEHSETQTLMLLLLLHIKNGNPTN